MSFDCVPRAKIQCVGVVVCMCCACVCVCCVSVSASVSTYVCLCVLQSSTERSRQNERSGCVCACIFVFVFAARAPVYFAISDIWQLELNEICPFYYIPSPIYTSSGTAMKNCCRFHLRYTSSTVICLSLVLEIECSIVVTLHVGKKSALNAYVVQERNQL